MDWTFLAFLAEPWFVIPWYAIGVVSASFAIYDINKRNTPLKTAMKWAWPIIIVFFSVIGIALYLTTARAPGIDKLQTEDEKKEAHRRYEQNMLRRVNGAVIHCVAGDGLGIMTGMVIARALRFNFWAEFWFEYAVGFTFGWFIFQLKSMMMMTDSKLKALAMAFRAEFFSMLTVMAGMGAVMAYVTPLAVTSQPRPLTFAFWGFGMLGLLVGYVFTYPMNWMMVKLGWKHGMGSKEDSQPVEKKGLRFALVGTMVVLGFGALLVPGVLAQVREHSKVAAGAEVAATEARPFANVQAGLRETLDIATTRLDEREGSEAMKAVDAAQRAAEVADHAAPHSEAARALEDVKAARQAIWMGRRSNATQRLRRAQQQLAQTNTTSPERPSDLGKYKGAPVLDTRGNVIGEVEEVQGDQVRIALSGIRDFWGFIDLTSKQTVTLPADAFVFGPARSVGWSYVTYVGNEPVQE